MLNNLYVYDIETYPNVFTCSVLRPSDMGRWRFEISERRNDGVQLFLLLGEIKASNGRMVGYNNVGFDYPVIHRLVGRVGHVTAAELYQVADEIINGDDRWAHHIWPSDRYVEQIDLYKIHHFDNRARSTSLKMLEFNMRSRNIKDLPYTPGVPLTADQIPMLVEYNDHDVTETAKFLQETLPMIEFRDELSGRYDRDFTNHNDTKIGKDYFIMALEASGVECFEYRDGRKSPRQTLRPSIPLRDVVLPWIQFNEPEFTRIVEWFRKQVITETKGVFKELHCTVDGFDYHFGTGGIHGSVDSQIVEADDEYAIIDLDVASYYPNLAITNRFYPKHLGEHFCSIYRDVFEQRKQHAKGTPENAALKLALNGVYGDSNNKYSPFYDPAYTMAITINGQLLLCMLAEMLSTIDRLTMVQINTDGLTVRIPHDQIPALTFISESWEALTGLVLERADYRRMFIRDVNNYIAEYTDGKLKRKGAYCYDHKADNMGWHQPKRSQIIAKAAEAALVRDVPVRETVEQCSDIMDFMRCTKVPRSSRLVIETTQTVAPYAVSTRQVQNITRYYISKKGGALIKIMPPTPAQVRKDANAPERRIGIDVGWNVTECNDLTDFTANPIDYEYYIEEANKLVEQLTT